MRSRREAINIRSEDRRREFDVAKARGRAPRGCGPLCGSGARASRNPSRPTRLGRREVCVATR